MSESDIEWNLRLTRIVVIVGRAWMNGLFTRNPVRVAITRLSWRRRRRRRSRRRRPKSRISWCSSLARACVCVHSRRRPEFCITLCITLSGAAQSTRFPVRGPIKNEIARNSPEHKTRGSRGEFKLVLVRNAPQTKRGDWENTCKVKSATIPN